MGRGFTQHNVVCIFYRKKAGKGLGDLHTNEGACFGMHCSVYQIKTIETKGREYPCLEYAVSLSVHQKVGGRLWVMSYVSLGNTIEIHFIRDFLTTILLMWFLCLLFCDCCMWSHNRGNSNHTEDLVQRSDMEMKDKARYKHFDPMWNIFLQLSARLTLFICSSKCRKNIVNVSLAAAGPSPISKHQSGYSSNQVCIYYTLNIYFYLMGQLVTPVYNIYLLLFFSNSYLHSRNY